MGALSLKCSRRNLDHACSVGVVILKAVTPNILREHGEKQMEVKVLVTVLLRWLVLSFCVWTE